MKDLTDMEFGFLKVLQRMYYDPKKHSYELVCQCECGEIIKVSMSNLTNGHTKSCGCKKNQLCAKAQLVHGESRSKLHGVWNSMLQRCNNPNTEAYKNYGGRGIRVCEEWKEYENFRSWSLSNEYNETLTLDRRHVNKDYCPENCRWVDWETQQNNRRNNKLIHYKGKAQTLRQWSKDLCMDYEILRKRIQ